MSEKSNILNHHQILQKIDRIAFQIVEDNWDEKIIYLVGIANKGYILAEKLQENIQKVSELNVELIELTIDKRNSINCLSNTDKLEIPENAIVILVDDVLNTGETLIHSSHIILRHKVKKLRTVVLLDRRHRLFPIKADYAGITLSTTIQDNIEVEYENGEFTAYLE